MNLNIRTLKKTLALTGAALSLYMAGSLCPWSPAAIPVYAADASYWEDVNESTRDDTIAYGIYIGKPLQPVLDEYRQKKWKRIEREGAIIFECDKKDYILSVCLFPQQENPAYIGKYRIKFYVKTQEMADEIFMRAEKNFSYNFGRPSIKKGMANMTWFLSDSFGIVVEYNEYDARLPMVKGYPYEITITRENGDYKKFFEARK